MFFLPGQNFFDMENLFFSSDFIIFLLLLFCIQFGENVRTVKLKLYITKNTYTTILSWMSILCLSLDYCNIYTFSENNNAL
jgi:hypothetical protein